MFSSKISSARRSLFIAIVALAGTAAVATTEALAKGTTTSSASSVKVVESRVTGYATAIDYSAGTITVGASYYGSGALVVSKSTSISLNNVNCSLNEIKVGDWVEARYVWSTKEATKLSVTR